MRFETFRRAPGKKLAPTLVELCNYVTLCYVVTGKRFAQTKYGFSKRFFQLKALRKIFLARNKRDLVAATEMPASSATSFTERSPDWRISTTFRRVGCRRQIALL